MNKKVLLILPLTTLLASCNLLNRFFASNETTSSSKETSNESDTKSLSTSEESFTFKGIKTFNFRNIPFNVGTKVADKRIEFEDFLNQEERIVDYLDINNIFVQPVGDPDEGNKSLCVGSSSGGGRITFNFFYTVKRISFTIQAYHKYIAYSDSWSIDEGELEVEGHSYTNLSYSSSNSAPDIVVDEFELDYYQFSISFSNSDAYSRTYIHELTVEYYE